MFRFLKDCIIGIFYAGLRRFVYNIIFIYSSFLCCFGKYSFIEVSEIKIRNFSNYQNKVEFVFNIHEKL